MHVSIINMYVNTNTDKVYNTFAHLYCLLHPFVVSYDQIISMNTVNELFHMLELSS